MDGKENTFSDISCPPANLPGGLYTSTSELPRQKQIRVFPNPTNRFLYLESDAASKIRIFDVRGRLLAFYPEPVEVIDLQNFEDGIYILQMKNKHISYAYKIIKQ
ncbi:MAG: T9SS type A sorting domain-containing protein [Phaeodactylibacter sp.]|nr:T9SS type A sorting domain-containing protein [Phaeodactylibacter sp.]